MVLSSLSGTQIRRLIVLIKKKEALQAELANVERLMDGLQNASDPQPRIAESKPRRRRKRVKLKEPILKHLQLAGRAGMTVKQLATEIGAKPGSVSVWFYTTGRKITGIRKVGKATFSFRHAK